MTHLRLLYLLCILSGSTLICVHPTLTLQQAEKKYLGAVKSMEEAIAFTEKKLRKNNKERAAIGRDATIHCYERTVEIGWKGILKNILLQKGIRTTFAQKVIEAAYEHKLIENAKIWYEMINARNITSHTYKKKEAWEIYGDIRDEYYPHLKKMGDALEKNNSVEKSNKQ